MIASQLCVAQHSHEPDRPRRAGRGLLCPGCDRGLEQLVAELPALIGDLEQTLARSESGGPKVSGSRDTPLVFDPRAGDALHRLGEVLAAWVRFVAEQRGLHAHRQPTLLELARFLLRHHDWLVHRPEVGEYREQMLDARHRARSAVAPAVTRRIDLGPCGDPVPACDVTTGQVRDSCPGLLRAVLRSSDERIPDVVCTECGTAHPPTEFRALARRLRAGQESWLTTAQVSELLRVPSGTVRRWAVEDGWRRVDRTDRHATRWNADDAQATFERRRYAPSRSDVLDLRRADRTA